MNFFQIAKKGRNDLWVYILTIIAVIAAYVIGQVPMFAVLMQKIADNPEYDESLINEFMENPDFGLFDISRNMGFLLLLLMFVSATIMLLILVRKIHQKRLIHLITPYRKINWNKIWFSTGVWISIAIAFELVFYLIHPGEYSFRFNWQSYLVLVLISLTILPIQTSFEELFFRGYLLQGISLVSKNKWVPLIITSILFGLIHSANPEIEKYGFWTMQAYYLSAGLILGIMTIMDDGLELALGVHFATNYFAATLVGFEGAALQTDTLFVVKEPNAMFMFLSMAIGGIIFLLICYKKYNWKSFNTIFEDIPQEVNEDESSFEAQTH